MPLYGGFSLPNDEIEFRQNEKRFSLFFADDFFDEYFKGYKYACVPTKKKKNYFKKIC